MLLPFLLGGALGYVFGRGSSSSGSKPAKPPSVNLPGAAVEVLHWRGLAGQVRFDVGRKAALWTWSVTLPGRTATGVGADEQAAVKAAIREAIEQGGNAAAGRVALIGTSGETRRFEVEPDNAQWRWHVRYDAAQAGATVPVDIQGQAPSRGAAVLEALDKVPWRA